MNPVVYSLDEGKEKGRKQKKDPLENDNYEYFRKRGYGYNFSWTACTRKVDPPF